MKLRTRGTHLPCEGYTFNIHAMCEVNVYFVDDASSMSCSDLDVQLPDGRWMPMSAAFVAREIVPNNLNTEFAVPDNEESRQRGWND